MKGRSMKAILLLATICLSASACNSIPIKTWLNRAREKGLVREQAGQVTEKQTYAQASNYRCYSPEDDETWRARLALCCADPGKAGGSGTIRIKLWLIDGMKEKALVRLRGGQVQERLSFEASDRYRCYSKADDQLWRDRMALCCSGG